MNIEYRGYSYSHQEIEAWQKMAKRLTSGKPGVVVLEYAHDEGCPQLYGGPCCCTPDISVVDYTVGDKRREL